MLRSMLFLFRYHTKIILQLHDESVLRIERMARTQHRLLMEGRLRKNVANILKERLVSLIWFLGQNLSEGPTHRASSLALNVSATLQRGCVPLQLYPLPFHSLCTLRIGQRPLVWISPATTFPWPLCPW